MNREMSFLYAITYVQTTTIRFKIFLSKVKDLTFTSHFIDRVIYMLFY